MSESDEDFEMLEKRLEALTPDERILVASAFSQLLNLHNLTEEIVTARLEKAARLGEVQQSTRSTNKSLQRLINHCKLTPEDVFKALCEQNVELVFTAHPTQAMRTSLLKKYSKIRSEMERLHNTALSQYERVESLEEVRSQIQAAWRTDEIRRRKPSPQDESRQGLTYFHETIYSGLPVFLRRIDTALANIGQPRLPLDATPFTFGSWMVGCRSFCVSFSKSRAPCTFPYILWFYHAPIVRRAPRGKRSSLYLETQLRESSHTTTVTQ
jgi:phosphoenolpyruvate carboxylase